MYQKITSSLRPRNDVLFVIASDNEAICIMNQQITSVVSLLRNDDLLIILSLLKSLKLLSPKLTSNKIRFIFSFGKCI